MTRFLELEDLLALANDLGVGPVRDLGQLGSSAARPQTRLYGVQSYPSLDEQVAALLDSIVRNDPLVDGNKRLGWLAAAVFYGLNDVTLDAPDDPAHELVIEMASSHLEIADVAATLARWRHGRAPSVV